MHSIRSTGFSLILKLDYAIPKDLLFLLIPCLAERKSCAFPSDTL